MIQNARSLLYIPQAERDPQFRRQQRRSDRWQFQLHFPSQARGRREDHGNRCRWFAGLHTPWARSLSSPSHLGPVAWSFVLHRWHQVWRNTWGRRESSEIKKRSTMTTNKKKGNILRPRSCHALLTFSELSQRLLCCRVGSFHPASAPQCSWTCVQSWKCRLCRSSPLGSVLSQGHSLSSSPAGSPADHTLSYYQPAWADPLPHPEAERELKWSKGQGEEKIKRLEMEKFLFMFENWVKQWILYRVMVLSCWKNILHQSKLAGWSPSLYSKKYF